MEDGSARLLLLELLGSKDEYFVMKLLLNLVKSNLRSCEHVERSAMDFARNVANVEASESFGRDLGRQK
jgi:hypothetical protein